eukprot:65140_1
MNYKNALIFVLSALLLIRPGLMMISNDSQLDPADIAGEPCANPKCNERALLWMAKAAKDPKYITHCKKCGTERTNPLKTSPLLKATTVKISREQSKATKELQGHKRVLQFNYGLMIKVFMMTGAILVVACLFYRVCRSDKLSINIQ